MENGPPPSGASAGSGAQVLAQRTRRPPDVDARAQVGGEDVAVAGGIDGGGLGVATPAVGEQQAVRGGAALDVLLEPGDRVPGRLVDAAQVIEIGAHLVSELGLQTPDDYGQAGRGCWERMVACSEKPRSTSKAAGAASTSFGYPSQSKNRQRIRAAGEERATLLLDTAGVLQRRYELTLTAP